MISQFSIKITSSFIFASFFMIPKRLRTSVALMTLIAYISCHGAHSPTAVLQMKLEKSIDTIYTLCTLSTLSFSLSRLCSILFLSFTLSFLANAGLNLGCHMGDAWVSRDLCHVIGRNQASPMWSPRVSPRSSLSRDFS